MTNPRKVYESLKRNQSYQNVTVLKGPLTQKVPYADIKSFVISFDYKSKKVGKLPMFLVFDVDFFGKYHDIYLVSKWSSPRKTGHWTVETFSIKAIKQELDLLGI